MQIGLKIADLRTQHHISQKELGQALNVSTSVVGMWETQKRCPSLDALLAVADFFAVSIDSLLMDDRKLKPEQYQATIPTASTEYNKLFDTFVLLDDDNKDILIGEAKKLLKNQRSEKRDTTSIIARKA